MSTYQSKKTYSLSMLLLFASLMVNITLRTEYDIFDTIGEISINLTLIVMFIYLIKGFIDGVSVPVKLTNIYISIALFVVIFSVSFYLYERIDTLEFMKLILFLMFILGAVRTKWTAANIKMGAHLFGLATVLVFLHWIYSDFPVQEFESIFRNSNYLGVFLFVIWYFKILAIKHGSRLERVYFSALMVLNGILIYATSARSIIIAAAVILLAWIILKQFRSFFPYLFFVVVFMNVLFLFTYIKMQNTSLGMFLDRMSMETLGKSLFSGRNRLWVEVWKKVEEQLLFGYGLGVEAKDITSFSWTAHNQYVQFLLEEGIIGLLVFLLLLYSVWQLLIKRLNHYEAKLSACFFLGILVYENFELTLFQNNYPIAFLQWLIIVIGINFASDTGRGFKRSER